jgi:nitrogen fixation protein NifB
MITTKNTNKCVYPIQKSINKWFDEMQLYVAPSCNMLCNFCSRSSDCSLNGNNPVYLSRAMTPSQAVNWAISAVTRDHRIRVIKISGPGEPLCNHQTFEVFKRLQPRLQDYIFGISTNGLLLEEKLEKLLQLDVSMVDLSINAVTPNIISKLYSKLILNENVISEPDKVVKILQERQMSALEICRKYKLTTKINTLYFPGINDNDIVQIAEMCRDYGVSSMCLISGYPGGKFAGIQIPSVEEMMGLQKRISSIIQDVRMKTYIS